MGRSPNRSLAPLGAHQGDALRPLPGAEQSLSNSLLGLSEILSVPLSLDDAGLDALDSLATALARLRGQPGLILAFYDSPLLRDRIIAEIQTRRPELSLAIVQVDEKQPDWLPWLAENIPAGAEGIFALPAVNALAAVPRYLNYRREILARLGCPVVMWFPHSFETALRRDAPDFWAFRRHSFVFRLHTPWVTQISQKAMAESGDYASLQTGIALHRQLLNDLTQAGNDQTELAAILRRNLGDLLFKAQEWPQTRQELEQALELLHSVSAAPDQIAPAHLALGRTLYYLDEYQPAQNHYDAALGLYQQVGARLGQANVLKAIGDVQNFRDERDAALRSYHQALELYRAVGDRLGEANTIMSRADVLDGQGQTEQALADYEQAMKLYRAIGDEYSVARALYYLGQLHLRHNNTAAARAAFQQAIAIFNARGLPDIAAIVQRALDELP